VKKIKIVIADDHTIFRQGLRMLLAQEDDMEVVGEAADGIEALELAKKCNPDIILLDIAMPNMDGVKVAGKIKKSLPQTKIIVLTSYSDDQFLFEFLKLGVSGFVLKDSASQELIYSIRKSNEGMVFFDPSVSKKVMEKFAQVSGGKSDFVNYGKLSDREKEVLRLVAEGCATKEVAEKLYISPKTVENHRANIMKKLNIRDRTGLTKYALRLGLIDLSP
jgi:DNA-binding NarL/FixJ family response regulator